MASLACSSKKQRTSVAMDKLAFSSALFLHPSRQVMRTLSSTSQLTPILPTPSSSPARFICSYSRNTEFKPYSENRNRNQSNSSNGGRPNQSRPSGDQEGDRTRPERAGGGSRFRDSSRSSAEGGSRFRDNSRSSTEGGNRFRDNSRSSTGGGSRFRDNSYSSSRGRPSSYDRDGNRNRSSSKFENNSYPKSSPQSPKPADSNDNGDEFQFRENDSDKDGYGQSNNYRKDDRKVGRNDNFSNSRNGPGRPRYNNQYNRQSFNRDDSRDRNRFSGRGNYNNNNNDHDRFRETHQYNDYEEIVSEERKLVRQALASEENDLVYGVSPVLLALRSQLRGEIHQLFIQEQNNLNDSTPPNSSSKKQANVEALRSIRSMSEKLDIPIAHVAKHELNLLSENRPHQGVVLQASKRDFQELNRLPVPSTSENQKVCYLVLDEITDPQNAGALLRSAHFLGADGVIMCRRNSCSLSAVVSKASAGALELMNVYGISSMPKFLRTCGEDGWKVIGMACGDDAVSAKSLTLDGPTLVVLGSEGRGLRALVRQACETIVEIEGGGERDEVDSLNVSVAGAVALYQLLGR